MTLPGRNFSICQPLTDAQDDADRLYELMKTSSSPSDKEAPGDSEESTVGVNPNAYDTPPDRLEGSADALWGSEDKSSNDPSGTAQHYSNAVWDGFKASREKFLEKHFGSFTPSAANAKATLGQNFDHFKRGDHESNSPFTRDSSSRNPPVMETTLDKTKRLLGRV